MRRRQVGNVTVTTFGLPDTDFAVEHADAKTLKRYGFPVARTEEEKAILDRVLSRLSGRAHFIEPEFEAHPPRRTSRAKAVRDRKVENTDEIDIWAGCVLEASTPQTTFSWITAEFTVPNVASIEEGDVGMSSHWIGIDGYTTDTAGSQLCQCGVSCDPSQKGVTVPYLWVEWYPGDEIRLTSQKVLASPGDLLLVCLCTTGFGATSATATFVNLTTGAVLIPVNFSAPQGCSLGGESVEWITERPLAGIRQPLAQFGSVIFYGAKAGTSQQVLHEATTYGLVQMNRIGDYKTIVCEAESPADGIVINTWLQHE